MSWTLRPTLEAIRLSDQDIQTELDLVVNGRLVDIRVTLSNRCRLIGAQQNCPPSLAGIILRRMLSRFEE